MSPDMPPSLPQKSDIGLVSEMSSLAIVERTVLLNLPSELIHKILLYSVFARGVKRALRLRLVCKFFSLAMRIAIFNSNLLDDLPRFYRPHLLGDWGLFKWYIQTDHGAIEFWHSYLVSRVQTETNPGLRRFLDIRTVAERVNGETGTDRDTAIDVLCWPALKVATASKCDSELQNSPPSSGLDLLCAAACLNLLPLAKGLLQEGVCPTRKSILFSSPMKLAAWFGNAEMLQMFQEHTSEHIELGPRRTSWTGKAGPGSIKGAVIRGDMDIVRLAVYPPSRATPENDDFNGEPFGKVDRRGATVYALDRAQLSTRSPEVHKYLEGFFSEPDELDYQLALHCRLGNLEMVRYLLDAGADTRGSCGRNGNPLVEACRKCHEDIVEMLLERGADPNYRGYGANALASAAAGGSISIVRKILNHGVDISGTKLDEPIRRAIRIEHTAIIRLLLKLTPGLNFGSRRYLYLRNVAAKEGLDSMVELLEKEVPRAQTLEL